MVYDSEHSRDDATKCDSGSASILERMKKAKQSPTTPPLWSQSTCLEKEWNDKFDEGACAVLVGVKASGKTLMSLSYIRTSFDGEGVC